MQPETIERRALKNISVGAISFILTMLQTLFLVPILLMYWGKDRYGLWLVLMAGFSLLQTLDLGHQNYIGNELNRQYHAEVNRFRSTLSSALLSAIFLGAFEIAFCSLLIFSGSVSGFLGVSPELIKVHSLHIALLVLMAMWMICGSAGGVLVKVMIPSGRMYQAQWWAILMRLSQFIVLVVAAVAGADILIACICYSIVQLGVSILVFRYIRRSLPEFYPWWAEIDFARGLNGVKKSLVLTGNAVGQQLSNNGMVVLVSKLFGPMTVPLFTTIRTVTNTASSVTTIITNAIFPDMIRFHATNSTGKLSEIINVNWFVSGVIVNLGIILALPIVAPLYGLWTKGILEFDRGLFFLFAASISIVNFGSALTWYLFGLNDLRAQSVITLVRVFLVFVLGYVLSRYMGVLGVGAAVVVSEIFASGILPVFYVSRQFSRIGAHLSRRHVVCASIPPMSILAAGIVVLVFEFDFTILTLFLIPVFVGLYAMNWRFLGEDSRRRFWSLSRKFKSHVAFAFERFNASA